MANSEARKRAGLLDPNRERIAKEMSLLPGGPHTGNPDTVVQSDGTPIQARSIYNDYQQNYAQMGTAMLNPGQVPNSRVPGFMAPGQRLNAGYGQFKQPDINGNSPMPDMMEGQRLGMNGQPELPRSPMGLSGSAAIPGGLPPDMPGTTGQPLMPGSPGMANPGMVPGSTPQKKGQKKKGGKK